MLNKIIKYVEEKDSDVLKDITKYIDQKASKIIPKIGKVGEIHYESIILAIYEQYNKAKNKNLFKKRFHKKIEKIMINVLLKNRKYNIVKEFVKIVLGDKNIDMELLEDRVINHLYRRGRNNASYIKEKALEILNQTILEVHHKLNLKNWERKYTSVYSYLESYLRLSVVKVLKNETVIDVPCDILGLRNTSRVVSDEYDEKLNKVQKQRKKRIRKIIDKQNNIKIESINSQGNINKISNIDDKPKDDLEWEYYMKYLSSKTKNKDAPKIMTLIFKENYSITECSKKLGISIPKIKEIIEESKEILKDIIRN